MLKNKTKYKSLLFFTKTEQFRISNLHTLSNDILTEIFLKVGKYLKKHINNINT